MYFDDPLLTLAAVALVILLLFGAALVAAARFVFRINAIVSELERIRIALETLTNQPPPP